MEEREYVFSDKAFEDSRGQGKVKIEKDKLQVLKVENIRVDSQFKMCVRVSTDGLFRGTILGFPIIDVIINDKFVEITGLLIGKSYSGLILNLEYINETKNYLLDDFIVEAGDVIAQYLCNTYKLFLNRDIKEEEFNEWYFKLQKNENSVNDFIKSIVESNEFVNLNKDIESFIKSTYKIILRRDIGDINLNYWKNKYNEIILKNTDFDARNYIVDKMIYYKQFEYLIK